MISLGAIARPSHGLAMVAMDQRDLANVAALKLLIIWRRDARRADRVELDERFGGRGLGEEPVRLRAASSAACSPPS